MIPGNILAYWTPDGQKLAAILASTPVTAREEALGYRTSQDRSGFLRFMAARGITVADLNASNLGLNFIPLPSAANLRALVNAVAPG